MRKSFLKITVSFLLVIIAGCFNPGINQKMLGDLAQKYSVKQNPDIYFVIPTDMRAKSASVMMGAAGANYKGGEIMTAAAKVYSSNVYTEEEFSGVKGKLTEKNLVVRPELTSLNVGSYTEKVTHPKVATALTLRFKIYDAKGTLLAKRYFKTKQSRDAGLMDNLLAVANDSLHEDMINIFNDAMGKIAQRNWPTFKNPISAYKTVILTDGWKDKTNFVGERSDMPHDNDGWVYIEADVVDVAIKFTNPPYYCEKVTSLNPEDGDYYTLTFSHIETQGVLNGILEAVRNVHGKCHFVISRSSKAPSSVITTPVEDSLEIKQDEKEKK